MIGWVLDESKFPLGILDKGFHQFRVLASRRGFDAAGDIDAVGRKMLQGFSHLLRIQAAREYPRFRWIPLREDAPIKSLPGSSGDFGSKASKTRASQG